MTETRQEILKLNAIVGGDHVLSVKNPWAYLICLGIKDIENRTWPTSFRGRVLIHTTSTFDLNAMDNHDEIIKLPISIRQDARYAPLSAIIGSVEIVDCVFDHPSIWAECGMVTRMDRHKNVSTKSIYNWILRDPELFKEPIINIKGQLGIWKYPQL
jgi:hypothetical protein